MAATEQHAAVLAAVAPEFDSRLTPEQIGAEAVRALDDLRGAITDYSLVAAATELCRGRCIALVRPPEPADGS